MSDDYGFSGSRSTKNDKKAKRKFNKYKRGGHMRTHNVERKGEKENSS